MATNLALENNADLGICFDGDGDRVTFINEKGTVISGDNVMAFFAKFLQKCGQLAKDCIVVNNLSSMAIDRFLKTLGIAVHRSDVGDRNVFKLMHQVGASFGGEESGHLIFTEVANSGDALFAVAFAVAILSLDSECAHQQVSEIFSLLQPMHCIKINLKCDSIGANLKKQEALVIIQKDLQKLTKVIENAGGRILIRPSGTEDKIRIFAECGDNSILNSISNILEKYNTT
jgi:phosphoglucosamine mutase